MLTVIPALLSAARAAEMRRRLAEADWIDGAATAGAQSSRVKRNVQLEEGAPLAQALGGEILAAVSASPLFLSAALPRKIFPPLFSRYRAGDGFGVHVDNSIRRAPGAYDQVRTDLAATLFLSAPDDYEGGELVIEGAFGAQEVKLQAGDMVLYPASSLHRVSPITGGERLASFLWVQSLVRDDTARALLFDLDRCVQDHAAGHGVDAELNVRLAGVYHNLVRRWAET